MGGFSKSIMVWAGLGTGAAAGTGEGCGVQGQRAASMTVLAVAADSKESARTSSSFLVHFFYLACSLGEDALLVGVKPSFGGLLEL